MHRTKKENRGCGKHRAGNRGRKMQRLNGEREKLPASGVKFNSICEIVKTDPGLQTCKETAPDSKCGISIRARAPAAGERICPLCPAPLRIRHRGANIYSRADGRAAGCRRKSSGPHAAAKTEKAGRKLRGLSGRREKRDAFRTRHQKSQSRIFIADIHVAYSNKEKPQYLGLKNYLVFLEKKC